MHERSLVENPLSKIVDVLQCLTSPLRVLIGMWSSIFSRAIPVKMVSVYSEEALFKPEDVVA